MTTNRVIEFEGQTKTIAEWAEIYKIHPTTLRCRIVKYGYSFERAITKPTRDKTRLVNDMIA